ncbi:MAG: Crp/Fnr family transcriptional regulator [Chitinophagaceae bacterium]|nr:Crp/Fnr family transcriptional regulator [Chitinophagaceae bacterium]
MDNRYLLKAYLDKFLKLTDAEFEEQLLPVLEERSFAKKEVVIKAGVVENYLNFVVKGLLRKYYKKGKQEIITQISNEGHIIHCQESFHSRQPSEYFIQAIEPSTVVSITYDNMENAFASSQRMEHLGRLVITYTMVIKDRWQMRMVKMTPRERFINFVTRHPEFMQRVPQKYLASFLNIKPETFSRFKHLLKEHARAQRQDTATH